LLRGLRLAMPVGAAIISQKKKPNSATAKPPEIPKTSSGSMV